MKVCMLDIDGVLNSYNTRNFGEELSPTPCKNLNLLLEQEPDLKVVISSSWRIWGVDYMKKVFAKNGIKTDNVIDVTGKEHGIRGHQIQCWLDRHPEVTNFVIIDDSADMGHLMDHLVKTNMYIGLTSDDVKIALDILKKPM